MAVLLVTASDSPLYPIAKGVSKQLLPIYDGSMVYEPIIVLMPIGETRMPNIEMLHKN